ncbi:Uncharacterised protein [Legionella sainthelensi]|uniref:F-box protein n=1 Tax=Legionella sainthelensi TaxID=28087 RepID=UPI000F6B556D|nr:F-box protein [Legionella sainthelensi]VEB35398.1 Uncharacterised protein [Legionella sainthelensi]
MPIIYSDLPDIIQSNILNRLDNKNLLNAASVNKKTEQLVEKEKTRRGLIAIYPNKEYFVLGKHIITQTQFRFLSFWGKRGRDISIKEIIEAAPEEHSLVPLFCTLKEAKRVQLSQIQETPKTKLERVQVIFTVKLKGNTPLYINPLEEGIVQRETPGACATYNYLIRLGKVKFKFAEMPIEVLDLTKAQIWDKTFDLIVDNQSQKTLVNFKS